MSRLGLRLLSSSWPPVLCIRNDLFRFWILFRSFCKYWYGTVYNNSINRTATGRLKIRNINVIKGKVVYFKVQICKSFFCQNGRIRSRGTIILDPDPTWPKSPGSGAITLLAIPLRSSVSREADFIPSCFLFSSLCLLLCMKDTLS